MMEKKTYAEKLKSPLWQRKRLEIMQRDGFACRECEDSESTLHVHHLRYIKGNDPWEYDQEDLLTLCEKCHEKAHKIADSYEDTITDLELLFRTNFKNWFDLHSIKKGFQNLQIIGDKTSTLMMLQWAMSDEDTMYKIAQMFIENCKREVADGQEVH